MILVSVVCRPAWHKNKFYLNTKLPVLNCSSLYIFNWLLYLPTGQVIGLDRDTFVMSCWKKVTRRADISKNSSWTALSLLIGQTRIRTGFWSSFHDCLLGVLELFSWTKRHCLYCIWNWKLLVCVWPTQTLQVGVGPELEMLTARHPPPLPYLPPVSLEGL